MSPQQYVTLERIDFERLLELARQPQIAPAVEGLVAFDSEGCGPYMAPLPDGSNPFPSPLPPMWWHVLTADDDRLLDRCQDALR